MVKSVLCFSLVCAALASDATCDEDIVSALQHATKTRQVRQLSDVHDRLSEVLQQVSAGAPEVCLAVEAGEKAPVAGVFHSEDEAEEVARGYVAEVSGRFCADSAVVSLLQRSMGAETMEGMEQTLGNKKVDKKGGGSSPSPRPTPVASPSPSPSPPGPSPPGPSPSAPTPAPTDAATGDKVEGEPCGPKSAGKHCDIAGCHHSLDDHPTCKFVEAETAWTKDGYCCMVSQCSVEGTNCFPTPAPTPAPTDAATGDKVEGEPCGAKSTRMDDCVPLGFNFGCPGWLKNHATCKFVEGETKWTKNGKCCMHGQCSCVGTDCPAFC